MIFGKERHPDSRWKVQKEPERKKALGSGFCSPALSLLYAPRGILYLLNARYRKVTICPLVQGLSGAKVVLVVPVVTPFATAQFTAGA